MDKTPQIEHLKSTHFFINNTIPGIETNGIVDTPHIYLVRYTSQAVINSWENTTVLAKAYVVNNGDADINSEGPFILHWDVVAASTLTPPIPPLTKTELSIFAIVAMALSVLAIIAVIILGVVVGKRKNGYQDIQ